MLNNASPPTPSNFCNQPTNHRRKPFLFALHMGCLLGFLIVTFAEDMVGWWVVDPSSQSRKPLLIASVFFGVACMNLSEDTITIPARALINDLSSPGQQEDALNFFGTMQSVGAFLGLTIVVLPFEKFFPFYYFGSSMKACFVIAILVTLVSLISVMTVHEIRPHKEQEDVVHEGADHHHHASSSSSSLHHHHHHHLSLEPEHLSISTTPSTSATSSSSSSSSSTSASTSSSIAAATSSLSSSVSSAHGSSHPPGQRSFWISPYRALPPDIFRLWLIQFFSWVCVLNLSLWWYVL